MYIHYFFFYSCIIYYAAYFIIPNALPHTQVGVINPDDCVEDTEVLSSQAVSSKTRTVETITVSSKDTGAVRARPLMYKSHSLTHPPPYTLNPLPTLLSSV